MAEKQTKQWKDLFPEFASPFPSSSAMALLGSAEPKWEEPSEGVLEPRDIKPSSHASPPVAGVPQACGICHKTVQWKQRTKHASSHCQIRRFACVICAFKSNYKFHVQEHMLQKHGIGKEEATVEEDESKERLIESMDIFDRCFPGQAIVRRGRQRNMPDEKKMSPADDQKPAIPPLTDQQQRERFAVLYGLKDIKEEPENFFTDEEPDGQYFESSCPYGSNGQIQEYGLFGKYFKLEI